MIFNPVVISINNSYVPYLYICLKSLLAHIKVQDKYQIYVLQTGLSKKHKECLKSLQCNNLDIQFIDLSNIIKKYSSGLFAVTEHFTPETYYRFFLPELFPRLDKVLYLDVDTLIMQDIAPLFKIDIGDNYLGVTHDCEIVRATNSIGKQYSDYLTETLGVNAENYFQAGVMLVNLKKMREDDITNKLLATLKRIGAPKFVDQDILNMVCQNKVKFIPQNWNYTWHLPFIDDDYLKHIGGDLASQYKNAQLNPYIIHFTGNKMKPVDYPNQKYAQIFWKYVRETPYEKYFEKQVKTIVKNLLKQVKKKKIKLLKYKILSRITCGNLKKQFLNRQKKLQQQINEIQEKILMYK